MHYIIAFLCALSLLLGGTMLLDTRQDAQLTSAINTDSEATVAVIGAVQSLIESHNSLKVEVKSDIQEMRKENQAQFAEIRSDIAALKQGQAVAGTGGGMPQIVIISPSESGSQPVRLTGDKPVLSLEPLR